MARACRELGVSRATLYRRRVEAAGESPGPSKQGRASPRALTSAERQHILEVVHSDRFIDRSPAEICATLLDEGQYLCSVRTMYRVLADNDEVRERRNVLRHPAYSPPELLATAPRQLWSWDITKLRGPVKWRYFRLYVIMDVFSRYVTGWMVAEHETAHLAQRLIEETCAKERIRPDTLTIHSDRGSPMISKGVSELLADLGVQKTHSRPHVSNDNPYSEAQFKTLKYRPEFPDRFGSAPDARSFCRRFFDWYNHEHRHSGIGMMTPATVHQGLAEEVREDRRKVLARAYAAHPERFVNGRPEPQYVPAEAWINRPAEDTPRLASDKRQIRNLSQTP